MTLARRAFVAALAAPAFARAQTYPDRPIRFLIPLAAGSAVDVVARLVAEKMGEILGQRVFVENEPGAAGLIGMRAGARAAPDGYTVLAINDSVVTMLPNMKSDAGYDPFADFAAVTQLVGIKWVLVANPAFPPKTVAELIALTKAKPAKLDIILDEAVLRRIIGSPAVMARQLRALLELAERPTAAPITPPTPIRMLRSAKSPIAPPPLPPAPFVLPSPETSMVPSMRMFRRTPASATVSIGFSTLSTGTIA